MSETWRASASPSVRLLICSFALSRKQVEFEGEGKVLLSRLGDKIHATSAFCTHYGAPLVKGVLTADGRVTWCVPAAPSAAPTLTTAHTARGTAVSLSRDAPPRSHRRQPTAHIASPTQRASTCATATSVGAANSFYTRRALTNGLGNGTDAEDAPAPSAIHSFKAQVVNGKIQVTADPAATLSANKSRPPTLAATAADVPPSQTKGVVIVGGGCGALMCVEGLREVCFDGGPTGRVS